MNYYNESKTYESETKKGYDKTNMDTSGCVYPALNCPAPSGNSGKAVPDFPSFSHLPFRVWAAPKY